MSSIHSWLRRIGLDRYAETFAAEDIDVDVLPELTEADLVELGVSFGDRKKLLRAIAALTSAATEPAGADTRSEEHTSELQSLMRISYAVFCLKTKKN